MVRVVTARLVALEARLLLGVQVLLVAAALQLLRVYADSVKQIRVLLRIHLIDALQLLRGLLVVAAE
ncbi:hypothetical protein ABTN34_17740, partial [Acinetobacter baumannii]